MNYKITDLTSHTGVVKSFNAEHFEAKKIVKIMFFC